MDGIIRNGSHLKCYTENNVITKVQHPNSKLDAQIMQIFCENKPKEKIYKYYNDLLNSKINIAQIYEIYNSQINELIIKQEYIKGDSLHTLQDRSAHDYFASNLKFEFLECFMESIELLISIQRKAWVYDKDIRIDLNTKNFIIQENTNKVIYIDITPPIYRSVFPKQATYPINIFLESLDTMEDQWMVLFGYLLRPFIKYAKKFKIRNLKNTIIFIRSKLLGYIEKYWGKERKVNFRRKLRECEDDCRYNLFKERISVIDKFLNDSISIDQLCHKYKNLSMATLMIQMS